VSDKKETAIDVYRSIAANLSLQPHVVAHFDQIRSLIEDYYRTCGAPLPWTEEQAEVAAATGVILGELAKSYTDGNREFAGNLLACFIGSIPKAAS
jgi:hypothetical protein